VLVFAPSPAVKPWAPALFEAFEHRTRARALAEKPEGREEALAERRRSAALAPASVLFAFELGRALAAAGGDDWEYTARARDLLASLYAPRRS